MDTHDAVRYTAPRLTEVLSIARLSGPRAGHSQEDTPILDALRNFHAEDTASFAIPAHKSAMGAPSYAKDVLGEQAFLADQTMLNGVDNRHESWGVQTAAQNLAAEALGADQCLFSTNGSTGSVHSAMSAVVGPEERGQPIAACPLKRSLGSDWNRLIASDRL